MKTADIIELAGKFPQIDIVVAQITAGQRGVFAIPAERIRGLTI